MTPTPEKPQVRDIPIDQVRESPLNPRKHFDAAALATLTESMRTHGQLTAALVRPVAASGKTPGHWELAAGHRRFRAAKLAGLKTLECKVREMTDAQFSEILTIENDEREDVHPLEQADGYKLLMEKAGYDVARIAERVQRSHEYVYERLSLLRLIPSLRKLFLEDRFSAKHAVVLSRLSDSEQAQVSKKPEDGYGTPRSCGLWRAVGPTLDEKEFPYVPVTVAELKYHIAHELRFDETAIELEELLPDTAIALEAAAETKTRVVSITYDSSVRPGAKGKAGERTYTAKFWKRADGLEESQACEYAALGIVRAGDGRGDALGVCLRRDACTTHWKAEVQELKRRAQAKKSGTKDSVPAKNEKSDAKRAAAERAIAVKENRIKSKMVAAAATIAEQLAKLVDDPMPATLKAARAALEIAPKHTNEQALIDIALANILGNNDLAWTLGNKYRSEDLIAGLKPFGIDVKKIAEQATVVMCGQCGCSEANPCHLGQYGQGPACKWVSTDPPICSNPDCLERHKPAAPAAPAKAKAKGSK